MLYNDNLLLLPIGIHEMTFIETPMSFMIIDKQNWHIPFLRLLYGLCKLYSLCYYVLIFYVMAQRQSIVFSKLFFTIFPKR